MNLDDNPTTGVILCISKDETIVKYSLLKESKQIFESKYRLALPTEEELIKEIELEKKLFLEDNNCLRENKKDSLTENSPIAGLSEKTPKKNG